MHVFLSLKGFDKIVVCTFNLACLKCIPPRNDNSIPSLFRTRYYFPESIFNRLSIFLLRWCLNANNYNNILMAFVNFFDNDFKNILIKLLHLSTLSILHYIPATSTRTESFFQAAQLLSCICSQSSWNLCKYLMFRLD